MRDQRLNHEQLHTKNSVLHERDQTRLDCARACATQIKSKSSEDIDPFGRAAKVVLLGMVVREKQGTNQHHEKK